MNTATPVADLEPLEQRLAKNSDGILEQIAREYGVSTFDVVSKLPAGHCAILPGEKLEEILTALTSWGDILFIVHTRDIVLECAGPLPAGSFGRGYFNIHGDSPIGGHIKADNCKHIAFVSRPFMGRESRSIQFFNGDGEAMFKIFVRRDKERNLVSEQVALFDQLQKSYASS